MRIWITILAAVLVASCSVEDGADSGQAGEVPSSEVKASGP